MYTLMMVHLECYTSCAVQRTEVSVQSITWFQSVCPVVRMVGGGEQKCNVVLGNIYSLFFLFS